MADDRASKAAETASALFGERVDTGVNNDDGLLNASFMHIYGEVWARPGLDLKTRSIGTVAALLALNRPDELRIHLKGALHVGWTISELRELFLQLGYYAGLPAGLDALRILDEVSVVATE